MSRKLFFGIVGALSLALWSLTSIAAMSSATVTMVSQSQKTFAINLGEFDGLSLGDVARFYLAAADVDFSDQEVGLARLVKLSRNQSIWYFQEQSGVQLLPEEGVAFFKESDEEQERLARLVKQKNYVLDRRRLFELAQVETEKDFVQQESEKRRSRLGEQVSQDLESIEGVGSAGLVKDEIYSLAQSYVDQQDLMIDEFAVWEDSGLNLIEADQGKVAQYKAKKLYKTPKRDLIQDEIRREQQRALTNRVSGLRHGAVNEQERAMRELSYIERSRNNRDLRAAAQATGEYRALVGAVEGNNKQQWSLDLSDDELVAYVGQKAILEEKRRLEVAKNYQLSYEFYLNVERGVRDHRVATTQEASSGDQVRNLSFEIGHEFYWGRVFEDWISSTTQLSYRVLENSYGLVTQNGAVSQREFGIGFHHYVNRSPIAIKQFIWGFGGGMRMGSADIEGSSQSVAYDVRTWYGQLLLKYRWHKNWGGQLIGQGEYGQYTRQESVALSDEENYSANRNIIDLRLGGGLNLYF